jgi:hypothetical protein
MAIEVDISDRLPLGLLLYLELDTTCPPLARRRLPAIRVAGVAGLSGGCGGLSYHGFNDQNSLCFLLALRSRLWTKRGALCG